jgi:hypothetical protein
MIAAYRHPEPKQGRQLTQDLIASVSKGVPKILTEIIALGRTLKKRSAGVLWPTSTGPNTSNGPTEAINCQFEQRTRLRPRLPQPHQLHRQIPARDRWLQTLTTPSIVKSLQTHQNRSSNPGRCNRLR